MTPYRYRALALILVSIGFAVPAAAQPPVNKQALALKEFGDKTTAYMELHTKLAEELPTLPTSASADQIKARQRALGAAIREARRDAREGAIFSPSVAPQFRQIIRQDLQSRDMRDAFAAMQEVPSTVALHINDHWPPDAPRATVPPRLLTSLYPLPEGLEYRFIDRHLVLLDTEALLIVDIVRNVVPSVVRRRL
jgi:hypothetical protein